MKENRMWEKEKDRDQELVNEKRGSKWTKPTKKIMSEERVVASKLLICMVPSSAAKL